MFFELWGLNSNQYDNIVEQGQSPLTTCGSLQELVDVDRTNFASPVFLPRVPTLRCIKQVVVCLPDGNISATQSCVWRTNTVSAGKKLAVEALQECHRQEFFLNPAHWWGNCQREPTSPHPDFKHSACMVAVWLSNRHKFAGIDQQLARCELKPTGSSSPHLLLFSVKKLLQLTRVMRRLSVLPARSKAS